MKSVIKQISEIFELAIRNDLLSSEERNAFSNQLGCIAFESYCDGIPKFNFEKINTWLKTWDDQEFLLVGSRHNKHNKTNEITAEYLVKTSVELNFLSNRGGFFEFKNISIKDYFCAFYCSSFPLNAFILENIPNHTWRFWAKLEPNLPHNLVQYMKDHLQDLSHQDAFSALFNIGNSRVRKLLIQNLDDKDSSIRTLAAGLLGKLDEKKAVDLLITTLSDEDEKLRISSAEALGEIGDERAVEALINSLKDDSPEVKRAVVYALGYIGNKLAVDPLILLLNDENLSYSVAISLGNLKDDKAVFSLINKLNGKGEETLYWVINALGKIGNKRAIKPLLEILRKTDNKKIISKAAWALGELGDREAFNYLIDDIQSGNNGVIDPRNPFKIENAIDAVASLRDTRAIPVLIAALNNDSWFIRKKVVEALGKIKDPASKDTLTKLTKDKDQDVRASAKKALEELSE